MAAAVWDVLAKAANLAQMSGLHAAMLVVVLTSLLRVHQRNERECARLERCHRRLHSLLQGLTTGCCSGVELLLCSEVEDPFGKALGDAAGLVESYRRSTLWWRVRTGRRMATQLRDMQDVIDSYCDLLLFVNALQRQADHAHALHPSPDTSTTISEASDDTSAQADLTSPGAPATRDAHRANGIGQGGVVTDPADGCERNVPALLSIVISQAVDDGANKLSGWSTKQVMATAARAWDVLAKAANVAQVIAVLVAVYRGLLRVQQSNGRECAELERRTRRLLALLQGPTTGAMPRRSEMVMLGPIVKAIGDAAGLVDSYRKSSLWRRVRSRGRMATQLRDMQDLVDYYCMLLLLVDLFKQQPTHHHTIPLSPDTSVCEAIEPKTPSWHAVSLAQTQRADDGIVQGNRHRPSYWM